MNTIKEFPNCPKCGKDERLMHSITLEEIAKKNMKPDEIGNTQLFVNANFSQTRVVMPGTRLPAARRTYDVCMNCGTEYLVRIERGFVIIPLRQGDQAQFV